MFITVIVSATLLGLAAIHLYWAFGGRWGATAAVPEVAGKRAFSPGITACLIVAALLATASGFVWLRGFGSPPWIPAGLPRLATIVLAIAFGLRAMGDFRLVGFFKRTARSRFARLDTAFYSPLCLSLSMGCAWLSWSR